MDETAITVIDTSQVSTSDDLSAMGAIADEIASKGVFEDYQDGCTENTKRRQKSDLAVFARYLEAAGIHRTDEELYTTAEAWRGMSHGIVQGFIKWQGQEGYAIGSINVRLATVKTYCALATRAKAITEGKLKLIQTIKGYGHKRGRNYDTTRETVRKGPKKADPTLLSNAHMSLLKQQDSPRDALLMCLLLDHGLRCSEIASLLTQDIDLASAQIIFYREKVDLEQTHALTRDTLAAAMAYLAVEGTKDRQYLFMGYKGQRITTKGINERVKLLGERLGIDHLSPHDCRHAWATKIMRVGKTPIKNLQDAGGWKSPAMPLRYAASSKIANEGVILE
jgi:integrase